MVGHSWIGWIRSWSTEGSPTWIGTLGDYKTILSLDVKNMSIGIVDALDTDLLCITGMDLLLGHQGCGGESEVA